MSKLKFYPASDVSELAWPNEIQDISMETRALEFLTDFKVTKPLVIESSVSAIDVKNLMIKSHVKLKFVINEGNQILGVISTEDLEDQKLLQRASDGFLREDIVVTDMMRPKSELVALSYKELANATIGDVIEVLKDSGQQHCLVIDQTLKQIRGIFSASDISRMLQLSINIQDKSSFYKVFSATEKRTAIDHIR
ncbi:CBS domain-containing protein [Arenicella xantha]|uniref:CBS domain protein n=1 Tax=Arenicella xantha TaxID=644221 RepID=A0A395JJN8_9GAMM|nr:CBS domain-containing protein [Arenicella xantha]RBP50625.1 CBS domain protein [Arenicella xantha]